MKSVLVIIAGFLTISVAAQQKNVSISHSINDDGNTLSVKIKGTVDGKPVDYNRTFDVTGMSKAQKDVLKERVYDSLGLPSPVAPVPPIAPTAPRVVIMAAPASPAEPGEIPVQGAAEATLHWFPPPYSQSAERTGGHPTRVRATFCTFIVR